MSQTKTDFEARREREHYAYISPDEREREFERDEITDAAERLSLPMEHSFDYTLEDDRLYSEFGLSMDEVIMGGLHDSRLKAMFDNDWQEEVVRREFQVAELDTAKTLHIGEKLVVFSPIPDDVASGKSKIKGYNRARMRMLVRITEKKSETDFSITTFSLDKSDRRALQAAAHAIGHKVTDTQSSNETVSQPKRVTESYTSEELVAIIRNAYDFQLSEDLGGEWIAGMPPITPDNAYKHVLNSIEAFPDIFQEHKKTIKYIQAEFFGSDKADALENTRQNFAARLDALRDNKHFANAQEAGDAARAEGKSYEGDCPPGVSTAVQAEKLGYAHAAEWKVGETRECVNCPLCKNVVSATNTEKGIECHGCDKMLTKEGKVIDLKAKREVAKAAIARVHNTPTKPKKGPKLTVKIQVNFGGATKQVFDQKGSLIAEGQAAEKLVKKSIESV